MTKKEVVDYFDRCAPSWDANMIRNEEVIKKILDNGGIKKGVSVLDVACGTGVLFPDYLARNVSSVLGVDISPEMAKIAAGKCDDPRVRVLCSDVTEMQTDELFDCIMVYNAFPHFPEPRLLIQRLSDMLRTGGRLSVAHGMSRDKLAKHHSGEALRVSLDLPDTEYMTAIFSDWLDVDCVVSDDEMYQVSGIKR